MTTRYAPRNLHALPTLTEVIEVAAPAPPVATAAPPIEAAAGGEVAAAPPSLAQPPIDEEKLVGEVLAELERHVDLMLEDRLREAIDTALARLADGLVRDLREELGATLRDVVARAVSQELARLRGGQA